MFYAQSTSTVISGQLCRAKGLLRIYPVNMPDTIWKRFFFTVSYGHYVQRAARIGPDRICQIKLPASVSAPFFQRRHGLYCVKPTRIRCGWPGEVLARRIWSGSKPVRRNHQAQVLAGRNWSTTSFPLLDSVPVIHRRPK